MNLILNKAGLAKAKRLIKEGNVDLSTKWAAGKPNTDEENGFLEDHSYEEYGEWFLAINADEPNETKSRYEFPFGNFEDIFREGLIAAEQRAGQYHHTEIEEAASLLLEQIEKKTQKV